MGNRAIVAFPEANAYVYLHWNGGPESVYAFLDYLKSVDCRCDDYGAARFCQVAGNFFGGTYSLGVRGIKGKIAALDPGDNGVFVVKDWLVLERYTGSREWTLAAITAEAKAAREHDYWKNTDEHDPILTQIAEASDRFFQKDKAA
jgi:hypothetical protein